MVRPIHKSENRLLSTARQKKIHVYLFNYKMLYDIINNLDKEKGLSKYVLYLKSTKTI